MITQLRLKSFAAFTALDIDFSPGINIIIGENGTGKTQLLKFIVDRDQARRTRGAEA